MSMMICLIFFIIGCSKDSTQKEGSSPPVTKKEPASAEVAENHTDKEDEDTWPETFRPTPSSSFHLPAT